jgi:hypothetical protein
MKFSSYNVLAVLMITTLLSCGKNNNSGSTSGVNQNPVYNPNLSSTGTTAHGQLKTWFESATEPTSQVGSKGEYLVETSQVQQGFTISGSFSLCIGGLVNIGNCNPVLPNKCYERGSDGRYYLGTPFISNNIFMGCPNPQVYNKANNLELKASIYGITGMELKDVQKSSLNPSVFTLSYFKPGAYSPSKIITIDISLASFVNPVHVRDIDQSQVTSLKGISVRAR